MVYVPYPRPACFGQELGTARLGLRRPISYALASPYEPEWQSRHDPTASGRKQRSAEGLDTCHDIQGDGEAAE
jgi:hypothetical protein